MGTSEAEELGLGFPSPFPSPSSSSSSSSNSSAAAAADAATVEALNGEFGNLRLEEKQEEKSEGADQEITEAEENVNFDKDSASSKEGKGERFQYPLRPDEPDCSYYIKTGSCKYGLNCKFNHPPRKRGIKAKSKRRSEPVQASNEKQKENSLECSEQTECKAVEEILKEASSEMVGHTECMAVKEKKKEIISGSVRKLECKYYSMPGGCKYGKACKYIHNQEKTEIDAVDLNFLGLPMRPGERECPYYMRTGGCKFASNCRFHHPDPTAVGGRDLISGYHNGGSPQQHASPAQLPVTSWPLQRTPNEPLSFLDESPSYVPGIFLPPQGFHPNPQWNGYQAPVNQMFPPEVNMQHPLSTSTCNANGPVLQLEQVNEYSERPGQPECQYFMKTGNCKFKSACRFHHPKSCFPTTSGVILSPMGLPLKPNQPVCTHYSRYKICKYGRACKYDHPMDFGASASAATVTGSSQIISPDSSIGKHEVKMEGSSNAPVQESEW